MGTSRALVVVIVVFIITNVHLVVVKSVNVSHYFMPIRQKVLHDDYAILKIGGAQVYFDFQNMIQWFELG